ncbi:MAG: hypothetical protein GWN62_19080 [Aliifodinibius sp.]|nr:hypothetical protein [Fodinibius sp.]
MNISPKVLWALLRKPRWFLNFVKSKAEWGTFAEEARNFQNMLTRRDDGAHPHSSPFYFEWWYFDIIMSDNSVLVIIFHLTDLIKPAAKKGSVNISYYHPRDKGWTHFIPYSREFIEADVDECNVRIGTNFCKIDQNGNYIVHIDEPGISGDICFLEAAPGWRPGNGAIYFGNPEKYFAWVVPQPRAKVNGKLCCDGKNWEIKGKGYHDHNWGTVSIIETLTSWSWGRVYMDDITLIYADMLLSPQYVPARALPFLLVNGSEFLVNGFLSDHAPVDIDQDFLTSPQNVHKPIGWYLNWEQQSGSFELQLTTQYVVEYSDLLRNHHPKIRKLIDLFVAHPYYIRCLTEVEGEIKLKGLHRKIDRGHAVCEQMVLRGNPNR